MPENSFTILAKDNDQHLVFGWASVVITVNGEVLEDRQHDMIDPEDLEEAAYDYVLNFRDTGEEHLENYRKKGRLVESCVFTEEKQRAIGIPEGILPVGWWIGFKIDDPDTWQRVKDGTYKMFSIEGKAEREPVEKANRPTGCGVLVVQNGKVLAGKRMDTNQIGGPGGHIEAGETAEEAARREAYEEFGILCNNLQPLGIQDGGKYGTSAVFMCSNFSGTPKTDEEEMTEAMWVNPREVGDAFPPFKQSLELLPKTERTAKSFEEVLKFNPFHDAIGRFSSAQGMRTYSANPKTRAGQLAIGRSAANHGHVLNVHAESKGESIKQNQQWITSGKYNGAPAAQTGHYGGNPKKNPGANVAPKATTNTNTQANQKQPAQNASQSTSDQLAQSVANVTLTKAEKTALSARDAYHNPTQTTKVANDHYQDRVDGKDISDTFDVNNYKGLASIDAIAKAQGWNVEPTVTNDRDVFDKAVKQSGSVLIRSVEGYGNLSGNNVANKTMTDGNYSLGGNGMKAYGSGMYMVQTSVKKSDGGLTSSRVKDGQSESYCYGNTQMMATIHPSAKIASPAQAATLKNQFFSLTSSQQKKYGNDRNAYIASKGYDGVCWHDSTDPTAYTTVFNKSALIFYGGVSQAYL